MRRVTQLVAVAAAAALGLSACGGSSAGGGGTTSSSKSDVKVGMAYDIGGRGDQSFNDSAARGLDKAKTDLGVQVKELEASANEAGSAKEERLRLLAQAGYNPVFAIGFVYAEAVGKVAKEFPDVRFAIVDDASLKDTNVTSLVFAENESSFLVGTVAAQATKAKNVGFIGGVDTPLLNKFEAGFTAGVHAVDKSVKVQVKYLTQPPDFSGFASPDKGKTAAQGMLDGGADVIYAAAGGSGSGAFEAVAAKKAWAIGVDSDQYLTAAAGVKQYVLTSALKDVDVAVYNMVDSVVKGSPLTGVKTFDLKVNGVGYADSNPAVKDFQAKTDDYKQQIIDGKIKVPTAP